MIHKLERTMDPLMRREQINFVWKKKEKKEKTRIKRVSPPSFYPFDRAFVPWTEESQIFLISIRQNRITTHILRFVDRYVPRWRIYLTNLIKRYAEMGKCIRARFIPRHCREQHRRLSHKLFRWWPTFHISPHTQCSRIGETSRG